MNRIPRMVKADESYFDSLMNDLEEHGTKCMNGEEDSITTDELLAHDRMERLALKYGLRCEWPGIFPWFSECE